MEGRGVHNDRSSDTSAFLWESDSFSDIQPPSLPSEIMKWKAAQR